MMFFQFVFAAITVIILAGALLGRMNFKAWVIFCPLWMTFVYTVGAYSIWGGGWLAQMGALDFSGGFVIHLAAATSGFVAAAIIGPRLQADPRSLSAEHDLLMTLASAGILWLGWNGFNGGDPCFANADAAAAVLNANLATCVAVIVWVMMDSWMYGKASVLGAVNGMIAGLVAITPAAGYVDGTPGDDYRRLRRHHSMGKHEYAPEGKTDAQSRRYFKRVLDAWCRGPHGRLADGRARQSGND